MTPQTQDYILGFMESDERLAFEQELLQNKSLHQEVLELQAKFLPLDETALPQEPSLLLWHKIEREIEKPQSFTRKPSRFKGVYARVKNTGVGFALAASLALFAFPFLKEAPRTGIAVLVDENAKIGAVVEVFGQERVVVVALSDIPVPADKSLQVWTLQDKAIGPVSLGLLPATQKANFKTPPMNAPLKGQLYEITLEPKGGSPLNRPTGQILYKGTL